MLSHKSGPDDAEISAFSSWVHQTRHRLDAARRVCDDMLIPADSTAAGLVEQLSVAEEELRQQNEKLVESQAALEQQQRRYQTLFEFAPDSYLVTDVCGAIREANHAAAELLGGDAPFLVGKPLITFVAESERRDVRRHIDQLVALRIREEWDFTVHPRHGGAYVVSAIAQVTESDRKNGPQIRWILREVTDRRRMEDAIIADNMELERRVTDRTVQLTAMVLEKEELLRQSRATQEKLEAANRLTTDFLAVLSHEFRTPLQAICGYSEILEEEVHGPLNENQRHDIGRVRRSQEHLLGLVNTILDFSKLRSGQTIPLELEPVSVHEMIYGLHSMIEPQLRSRQLVYEYRAIDTSVVVRTARDKTQQILLNLLSNAIKFTEPGGCITVEAKLEGGDVAISVSDTGYGIPADKLDLVFEPFVQVVEHGQSAGTGLGLAISRNLAELMHGSLVAESEVGHGSRFTLRLPTVVPSPVFIPNDVRLIETMSVATLP